MFHVFVGSVVSGTNNLPAEMKGEAWCVTSEHLFIYLCLCSCLGGSEFLVHHG